MTPEEMAAAVAELMRRAVTTIPGDVLVALRQAVAREEEPARNQLQAMLDNAQAAAHTGAPLCQDTGTPTFFVTTGAEFPWLSLIRPAIREGVRRATAAVPLRPNAVDPLSGVNSGDNVGRHVPVIYWEVVEGDRCRITALPKGGGSENMSTLAMLRPSEGLPGAQRFIVDWMARAGGKPCPPTVVGVGLGGGADLALHLAKRSLLRPVGERSPLPEVARMEEALVEAINATGIGPMGLGGRTTVLDVHVDIAHRHPASLPVAIVVQCWAHRRADVTISPRGEMTWSG
ncbi:MAG: fumarate hydratase [Candidatus Thermoplasmatota archaeon]|nr:fumarate hydratase [Candidatus Thermoplasmatota archaeon]